MSVRESAGLILLVVSLVLFPFGYWLHQAWYLVAMTLACIGAFFMFLTQRMSRRLRNRALIQITSETRWYGTISEAFLVDESESPVKPILSMIVIATKNDPVTRS